jgi:hypothetical protein
MQWEIVTAPITKMQTDHKGPVLPLCTTCIQTECSYPIREHCFSIMGHPTRVRVFILNNSVRQVVACAGYVDGAENEENSTPPK